MKVYIIIIISILFFSCKSSQLSPKDSLVSISKNPCLKNCEVSDLHIYSNGTFVYNGVLNVNKKGNHKGSISSDKIAEIKKLLSQLPKQQKALKGRDVASITIKYRMVNTTYKSNEKTIKEITKLSEDIINTIP